MEALSHCRDLEDSLLCFECVVVARGINHRLIGCLLFSNKGLELRRMSVNSLLRLGACEFRDLAESSEMLGGPRARASSSHQAQDQCQYPRPQYALSRCAWQFQSFTLNLSHIAKCYRYRTRSRVQSYFILLAALQHVYDFFVYYFFTAVQPAVPLPGGKLQESAWTSKQLLSALMPGRFASKKNEAPEVLHALSPCCDLEDAWSVCVSMLDSVLHKNVPRVAIPCPCSCWVPKDLNLSRCQAIPVFAWRELCLAQQWTKLKRVNFASRLGALKGWVPPLRDSVSEGHGVIGVMLCKHGDAFWSWLTVHSKGASMNTAKTRTALLSCWRLWAVAAAWRTAVLSLPVSQLHRCLANEAGGLKLELVLGDSRRCLGKAPPSPVDKAEKGTLRPESRRKTFYKLGQVHET